MPGADQALRRQGRLGLVLGAAGLFTGVIALAAYVRDKRSPARIDLRLDRIVFALLKRTHLSSGESPGVFVRLAVDAAPAIIVVVAVVFAVAAWHRRDKWGVLLSLLAPALTVGLTELVAKPVIARGASLTYPSGHAGAAAAVATVSLVLLRRWRGWTWVFITAPAAVALPLGLGVSLLRMGVHSATDIVGGVGFGAAVALALASALPATSSVLPEPTEAIAPNAPAHPTEPTNLTNR
jgi:membrane-associated phospholipid phosphatase